MEVFIIIDLHSGWQCIKGVFDTWQKAITYAIDKLGCDPLEIEANDHKQYYIETQNIQ